MKTGCYVCSWCLWCFRTWVHKSSTMSSFRSITSCLNFGSFISLHSSKMSFKWSSENWTVLASSSAVKLWGASIVAWTPPPTSLAGEATPPTTGWGGVETSFVSSIVLIFRWSGPRAVYVPYCRSSNASMPSHLSYLLENNGEMIYLGNC